MQWLSLETLRQTGRQFVRHRKPSADRPAYLAAPGSVLDRIFARDLEIPLFLDSLGAFGSSGALAPFFFGRVLVNYTAFGDDGSADPGV